MKSRRRCLFCTATLFGAPLRCGTPVITGFTILVSGLGPAYASIYGGAPGSGSGGAPATGGNGGSPTAPTVATDSARAEAFAALNRTNQAVGAARALQDAARAAAASGHNNLGPNPSAPGQNLPAVPNGLVQGGLQVAPGVGADPAKWQGAELPVQATDPAGMVNIGIRQTAQQALLEWQTFNVGKETTVTFDQSAAGGNASQWVAFNKIVDPTGNPTQILGQIKAQGQVYLLNANGIIFGGSSQVNVGTLTASSLPINDNLVQRGLLNNPDAQFLFSGLNMPAGPAGTPAFTAVPPPAATGRYGDVTVQAGAILQSPTTAANVGGRIMLAGANVINEGTILTPDGQAILAAGLQVGIEAHPANDPSLRGLDIFIGNVGAYAGQVVNQGIIEAARGNITLTGRDVRQSGVLDSTTSVSLNGRIDISASHGAVSNTGTTGRPFVFQNTGTVSLGEGSVTRILPETASSETAIGTVLALRSQVNLTGRTIHFGKNSTLLATNGLVNIAAGEWLPTNPVPQFVQSAGQIYLDEDAVINVAGSMDVRVPVSQNIISVDLRGSELANSPLQRLGPLRNATVQVDIRDAGIYQQEMWVGTPLADILGFANLIQRKIGELTVAGGSVTLSAGSSVVMQAGSQIDVSGGSILYEGGAVETTRLIAGNRIIDIRDARPDIVYDGIFSGGTVTTDAKWGVTQVFGNPLAPGGLRFEPTALEGAAGGSLSVTAPGMALDGIFRGATHIGDRQRSAPPAASALTLSFTGRDKIYVARPIFSPTPPDIRFETGASLLAADPFSVDAVGNAPSLRQDRLDEVVIAPDILTAGGFGSLTLRNPEGNITISAGRTLVAPDRGTITLEGANIFVDGGIIAPAGSLSLTAQNVPLSLINAIAAGTALPPTAAIPGRGQFVLGESGVISTAGRLVNDRLNSANAGSLPLALAGGSVIIRGYSATLSAGGVIDVSGGARLDARGAVTYGAGGSLAIAAGRENVGSAALLGGNLDLGATLRGYSGSTGGSLSLAAGGIQLGGSSTPPGVLVLAPEFFNQGGFSSFTLTGAGLASGAPGMVIAAGTQVRPVAQSWFANIAPDSFGLSTITREEGVRSPVNLTFRAQRADDAGGQIITRGEVVMENGASIETDALGQVAFEGSIVSISGSVTAAGGAVRITGQASFPSLLPDFLAPTVLLSSNASISTAGKTVLTPSALGLRQGQVLAGGSITVSGNIVAESGARLDVSGTRGVLDLNPNALSLDPAVVRAAGGNFVPVTIESNAGSIMLSGGQMLYSDATLVGRAGGSSATGGSLTVGSGRFIPQNTVYHTAEANLVVRQSGTFVPEGFTSLPAGTRIDATNPGIGNFAVDRMAGGGFGSLALTGNVRFDGPVNIDLPGRLAVASGGAMVANDAVTLTAGHAVLGQAFRAPVAPGEPVVLFETFPVGGARTPFTFAPTFGSGSLSVTAKLIDIGNLSLQGIGSAEFIAPEGDVRGNGTLSSAGHLRFHAGQIYPTTAGNFSVFAYDYNAGGIQAGSVTIDAGALRPLPYSAGGTLGIYASQITQAGALRAPVGTIRLGWNGTGTAPVNPIAGTTLPRPVTAQLTLGTGSVTSVSSIDPISGKAVTLPYGISLDGTSWIDPSGLDITVGGVPSKQVNLSAASVTTENGSVVEIGGGGDLLAYRWISGPGGTRDVLGSSGGFAIIPGYGFDYAPYAPFGSAASLGGNSGYTNSSLRPGDQVTLTGVPGLPAGTYTLLPARYALLPGAFLVTPQSGGAVAATVRPDGSALVSGFRANNLDDSRNGPTRITRFEIASAAVVRQRSQYQELLANTFLRDAAVAREFAVPRLPVDAGYLSFTANTAMAINGAVSSAAPTGGRGSLIDINSPVDILINATGLGGSAGSLVLDASVLNAFRAESLLIGGLRTLGSGGASVTVNAGNLTLDNAGSPLTGSDIILVAKEELTIADGAEITGTGSGTPGRIIIGNDATPGSGNGTLVRVSAGSSAPVSRFGVGNSTLPNLVLGAGADLQGGSITLDSTSGTDLDPAARLLADSISLSSGQIGILLNDPGTPNPSNGLILSGIALESLQTSAKRLALLSYSSIDVYGTGQVGSRAFEQLALQSAAIRGFNTGGGTATFSAASLLIENPANRSASAPISGLDGSLGFDADQITLGVNSVRIDGFAETAIAATNRVLVSGTGSFSTTGDLHLIAPLVTGADAANHRIAADGALRFTRPSAAPAPTAGGLGAQLAIEGATVDLASNILLSSGELTLRATSGDLVINGSAFVDLRGTSRQFIDVTRHTSGGTINLTADQGSVLVRDSAILDVSAPAGGGNAGQLNVSTPLGNVDLAGTIRANAGAAFRKGGFSLDSATIAGGSLADLDAILNAGQFTRSRDYRFRSGDVFVDGSAVSSIYRVSADAGSILVTGRIDASRNTGGAIDLKANGSLTLASGSILDASAATFDTAGKGGSVTLEAGTQRDGVIDSAARLHLASGSAIDLSVASLTASSAGEGKFSGKLHLRAPRTAANDDVRIETIGSTINGASAITVEGYRLYDLTGNGAITSAVQNSIRNDATAFLGAAGTTTAGYAAMLGRLTGGNSALGLILTPGAEIINRNGSLTLGTAGSTAAADWDLSSFRFGPLGAAGTLTLRAAENLSFFNALSDGFSGGPSLWLAPLMSFNPLLPANAQSWSYRLTAGADFSAANFREVLAPDRLAPETGLLELGKNTGAATATGGQNATTASIIGNAFQVIRTGSGDIDIHTGRTVRLLNPFATIYTAGTQVADAGSVRAAGDFIVPILDRNVSQSGLGAIQQNYPAQYSMAGGNVTIHAGENIERKTRNNFGLIDDSSRQLPNNWLYRRGSLGSDGTFGSIRIGTGFTAISDPAASTTWWVDFSNFFQSIGALGGGNVTLTAGNDVRNVDAVIPTNARAPQGSPNTATFLELGGGDLAVRAGNDINAGVYYVERGVGSLDAGGSITTNATRSPSFGLTANLNNPGAAQFDPLTWMPTALFLGKSSFDVSARGNVLLGPASNPFLLPQSVNNKFWYKTYFSTFAENTGVSVESLGGDITWRNSLTLPDAAGPESILGKWLTSQSLLTNSNNSTAWSQPWLRLAESSIVSYSGPLLSLAAPSIAMTAFSGSLNLTGDATLFPSRTGQLELLAAMGISALQPIGLSDRLIAGRSTLIWSAATLNLSDANPASLPSPLTPLSAGNTVTANSSNLVELFRPLVAAFSESGSFTGINGVIQTKQARHTPGLLHRDDGQPVRVYALDGDISGLSLFTPKQTRVHASRDLTDIALYIQNLAVTDRTVVSAGRDIIAYNASSQSRIAATATGNGVARDETPQAGDIQISGPGTLEVLAGRNLDLGTGPNNADGTGTGLTSIGNLRNPFLTAAGADLVVAAGIGPATGLSLSSMDLESFISAFILTPDGQLLLDEIVPGIDFRVENPESQALLALDVFYRILRNAGRDFNNPESPGFGNYDIGRLAIDTLFGPGVAWEGEILTQGRDIRTRSGGAISIIAPGGGLAMANTTVGNPLAPPGIITESGGSVSIFTDRNVDIGIGRIFTLRGGDAIIWSSNGNIAAGSSSRTIQSAPPTRVVIDPQSASVQTDLAGLATGGGIGVLATVAGVAPGDVDLIAPSGIIDAGEGGIRVSGNINLAATQVVNAGNIAAGGTSSGGAASVAAPSVAAVSAASTTAAATTATTPATAPEQEAPSEEEGREILSLYTVEVIGYGGAADPEEDDEEEDEDDGDNEEGENDPED